MGWVAGLFFACLTCYLCVPMILALTLFWVWHACFLCVCRAATMCPCPSVCPCCTPCLFYFHLDAFPIPRVFPEPFPDPLYPALDTSRPESQTQEP